MRTDKLIAAVLLTLVLINNSRGETNPLRLVREISNPQPVLGRKGDYELPENGELSFQLPEQVGYAGLILANGGSKWSPSSFLYRSYGIKLDMWIGESEDYEIFHNGSHLGLFTSADSLAYYGTNLNVVAVAIPLFYGFDDFLIVENGIASFQQLRGKTLVVPEFTIADFFVRRVAAEMNLPTHFLKNSESPRHPNAINLCFTVQVDHAASVFETSLNQGLGVINGCSAWDPMNQKVVQSSAGLASYLKDRTLDIKVADVLVLNRGFAGNYPNIVRGLVHGLLYGNQIINNIKDGIETESLGWTHEGALTLIANTLTNDRPDRYTTHEVRELMNDCDFANYPVNRAYFEDSLLKGMSFQEHYISSSKLFHFSPEAAENVNSMACLDAIKSLESEFSDSLSTSSTSTGFAEARLSWRPTRITFQKNKLSLSEIDSIENMDVLEQLLGYVSANETSIVLLTGYLSAENTTNKGDQYAARFSKERAAAVEEILIEKGIREDRISLKGGGYGSESYGYVQIEIIEVE